MGGQLIAEFTAIVDQLIADFTAILDTLIAEFSTNRVRDRCKLVLEAAESHLTTACNNHQQGAPQVGSNTQHYTNKQPALPVDRETTQTAAAQTGTTASTPFTPLLLLQRDWNESGDPPIRYRDECNCFCGYHLRPSLGAAQ